MLRTLRAPSPARLRRGRARREELAGLLKLLGLLGLVALVALVACAAPPTPLVPIEMEPIGTVKTAPASAEPGDGGPPTRAPVNPSSAPKMEDPCVIRDGELHLDALKPCLGPAPDAKAAAITVRDRLEIKATAGTATTSPGGRVEITVTLRNLSEAPLVLYLAADPLPTVDIEVTDAKGRRVDLPAGRPPRWPKGTGPSRREARAARLTLAQGGSARLVVLWEAAKTRWAPERAQEWVGRGYPRAPAQPLPAGRYTLRVVFSILGADRDALRLPVDVRA